MRNECLTILFTLIISSCLGQEGQFSQYFASSAILNPAFTGTVPNLSFNSNYKRGGSKDSESYLELMQVTFMYPLKRTTSRDHQFGGAGVSFFQERRGIQGVYNTQKVLLTGAYSFRLSRLRNQSVVLGLQGGIAQHRLDDSNLKWGSQFNRYIGHDPGLSGGDLGSDRLLYPTFNFGVIYSSFDNENRYVRDRSLLLGLSVDNLNRPNISFTGSDSARKSFLFKAFGSAKLPISPRWYIHPSTYILYSQGNEQINAGLYLSSFISSPRAKTGVELQFGSWYRLEDSIIVLAGFQVENLRIGFSFDLNTQSFDINETAGGNLPTYELSLTYNLDLTTPLRNISSPIF